MELPVLIEPIPSQGFRATTGEPFSLQADGSTPEEAIRNLRTSIGQKLQGGKRLVAVDFDANDNPWLDLIGTIDPNDPLTKEWEAEMEAFRLECENDPNRP